jgi:hypothetical protein
MFPKHSDIQATVMIACAGVRHVVLERRISGVSITKLISHILKEQRSTLE